MIQKEAGVEGVAEELDQVCNERAAPVGDEWAMIAP